MNNIEVITTNFMGKEIKTFFPIFPKINKSWILLKQDIDIIWFKNYNGLLVALSGHIFNDKKWIHISFSRKSRMPEYLDMKLIKDTFVEKDKKAIMVFPEIKYHVNVHPYCLHFYICLDNDGLPEFSQGLGII